MTSHDHNHDHRVVAPGEPDACGHAAPDPVVLASPKTERHSLVAGAAAATGVALVLLGALLVAHRADPDRRPSSGLAAGDAVAAPAPATVDASAPPSSTRPLDQDTGRTDDTAPTSSPMAATQTTVTVEPPSTAAAPVAMTTVAPRRTSTTTPPRPAPGSPGSPGSPDAPPSLPHPPAAKIPPATPAPPPPTTGLVATPTPPPASSTTTAPPAASGGWSASLEDVACTGAPWAYTVTLTMVITGPTPSWGRQTLPVTLPFAGPAGDLPVSMPFDPPDGAPHLEPATVAHCR